MGELVTAGGHMEQSERDHKTTTFAATDLEATKAILWYFIKNVI